MTTTHDIRRYHAFDQLRAAMMLLGLVLHSATSFTATSLGAAWPYQDTQTNVLFDLVVFFIHLFRMPVFFVMAGFFGAFLYYRRGSMEMVRNRLKRILLPLAAAWVVLFPLTAAGFVFANNGGPAGFPVVAAYLASGTFLARPGLIHLWFLYDLLFFYAVALLVMPLVERVSGRLRERGAERFAALVTRGWAPWVLAGVTMLTLYPMPTAGLETSTSFTPPLRVLAAYGIFFGFGWLVYVRREVVDAFAERLGRHVVLGTVASVLYLVAALRPPLADPGAAHLLGITLASLAMWLLIFAITGLFVRYLDRPSPVGRYLSDASYWLYLIHLPVTIWMPGLLAGFAWPAPVKFGLVLGTTVAVTLITYHYFVRATTVGVVLNGRRYPRALPRYEPPAAPVRVAA